MVLYDPIADGDEIQHQWNFNENQYIYIATEDLNALHHNCLKMEDFQHVDEQISEQPWGERLFYANDLFGNPICFVDKTTMFLGN